MRKNRLRSLAVIPLASLAIAGCNPELWESNKHLQPLSSEIKSKIRKIGSTENAPLYIRIDKEEAVLEAWKKKPDGTYALLKTYPICAYSGKTGPKKREGDRQAPEGFYSITPGQMNPNSSYYLSFNLGYPNAFDRSYGRTGKHLMVHGSCSSRGCYAMEDAPVAEIYALGREAFEGGQRSFKVHAFPFRMTPENMARNRESEHFAFWQNLKNGYDHFQITKKPPQVEVCNRTYIFNPNGATHFNASAPCPDYQLEPSLMASLTELRAKENVRFRQESERLIEVANNKKEADAQAMAEAQLDLLKRKERLANGQNPDGLIAGLIKGNPGKPFEQKPDIKPIPATAQTSSPAPTEASKPASSGFFSKITSAITKPFKPETPPQPIVDATTPVITALPKPRQ